jgi:hypothetical protein
MAYSDERLERMGAVPVTKIGQPGGVAPTDHTHDAEDVEAGAGTDGQVLTLVAGTAAWAAPTGGGGGSPLVGTFEIDEGTGVITINGANGGVMSGTFEIDEGLGTISIDFS